MPLPHITIVQLIIRRIVRWILSLLERKVQMETEAEAQAADTPTLPDDLLREITEGKEAGLAALAKASEVAAKEHALDRAIEDLDVARVELIDVQSEAIRQQNEAIQKLQDYFAA